MSVFMHICMCEDACGHGCTCMPCYVGSLRLVSGINLHPSSTLFTVTESVNQTLGSQMWLVSLYWGMQSLTSKATIARRPPCLPGNGVWGTQTQALMFRQQATGAISTAHKILRVNKESDYPAVLVGLPQDDRYQRVRLSVPITFDCS